mmetsp:Transcript_129522/g.223795  ORF Transcript_129522/g.223795 Transcript_129522/m.223795 type:complete len:89 (-) Transcript_129522:164-430(-)
MNPSTNRPFCGRLGEFVQTQHAAEHAPTLSFNQTDFSLPYSTHSQCIHSAVSFTWHVTVHHGARSSTTSSADQHVSHLDTCTRALVVP